MAYGDTHGRRWVRQLVRATALVATSASGHAFAADAIDTAGRLYDDAAAAQARGDFGTAARLFARADGLAPAPAALEAALQAALRADDAALGMALVERAVKRQQGSASAAAEEARRRFAARVGRLRVECRGCRLSVDGEAAADGETVWLTAGDHFVVGSADGWSAERSVTVRPGAQALVRLRGDAIVEGGAHPALAVDAKVSRRGISPAWFWVGLGGTALAGGATLASGLHTMGLYREFRAAPSQALADRGRAAETRTYLLGGVTGALGVTTTLLAAFAVRWSDEPTVVAFATPSPGGLLAGLAGRF